MFIRAPRTMLKRAALSAILGTALLATAATAQSITILLPNLEFAPAGAFQGQKCQFFCTPNATTTKDKTPPKPSTAEQKQ